MIGVEHVVFACTAFVRGVIPQSGSGKSQGALLDPLRIIALRVVHVFLANSRYCLGYPSTTDRWHHSIAGSCPARDLVGIRAIIGNTIILDGFRFIVLATGQLVPFVVR